MKINLQDIPEEGKSFDFDDKSGELVHVLQDLIGNIPHQTQFFIKPINSKDFEMTGFILYTNFDSGNMLTVRNRF
jgi:uncharacterized protein